MDECTRAELWLPVVGYEGLYEVSNSGQVRSLDRMIHMRNGQVRQHRERILRPHLEKGGRLVVNLPRDGNGRTIRYMHHLILEAFVGPRPTGMEACHENDIKTDNRLENLRWDTRSANMFDRVRNGMHPARNRMRCPLDHVLSDPNLVACMARKGFRTCLACSRTRADRRRAQKAGRPFDFKATADRHYAKIMH